MEHREFSSRHADSRHSYWKDKNFFIRRDYFALHVPQTFISRDVTCLAQPEGVFKVVIMHNGGDLLHYYVEI